MTQAELAIESGHEERLIAAFEEGRRLPTSEELGRLAAVFGVSPNQLLTGGKDHLRGKATELIYPEAVNQMADVDPPIAEHPLFPEAWDRLASCYNSLINVLGRHDIEEGPELAEQLVDAAEALQRLALPEAWAAGYHDCFADILEARREREREREQEAGQKEPAEEKAGR